MWILRDCEIYRDGGSYGATLVNGDRVLSLWLQVGRWDKPEQIHYTGLFVSQGDRPDARQDLVPRGGPEHEWLRQLEHVDRASATSESRGRLDEFIVELRRRCSEATP